MTAPKRIQRRRTKGWRMPEGAVYVGRPSLWGNPFPVDGDTQPWFALALGEMANRPGRIRAVVKAYRWWLTGGRLPIPERTPGPGDIEYSDGSSAHTVDIPVGMGLLMLTRDGPFRLGPEERPDLAALRGKDLACWCPLDQPCHADVLLELANR